MRVPNQVRKLPRSGSNAAGRSQMLTNTSWLTSSAARAVADHPHRQPVDEGRELVVDLGEGAVVAGHQAVADLMFPNARCDDPVGTPLIRTRPSARGRSVEAVMALPIVKLFAAGTPAGSLRPPSFSRTHLSRTREKARLGTCRGSSQIPEPSRSRARRRAPAPTRCRGRRPTRRSPPPPTPCR